MGRWDLLVVFEGHELKPNVRHLVSCEIWPHIGLMKRLFGFGRGSLDVLLELQVWMLPFGVRWPLVQGSLLFYAQSCWWRFER